MIQKIADKDTLTVRIEGSLDTQSSPNLTSELEGQLTGVSRLILDLEKVPYISSAGVRAILLLQQTMDRQGSLTLTNVNSSIVELFDTIGFLNVVTIDNK
ncbi:MAG: STAS domain-containing protein [Lachnospiraceae bacterium]|nr:STAS domain-containing protein [Lachnospiraceae bacterium]